MAKDKKIHVPKHRTWKGQVSTMQMVAASKRNVTPGWAARIFKLKGK